MESKPSEKRELTENERQRMMKNKARAEERKKARVARVTPYTKKQSQQSNTLAPDVKVSVPRVISSDGGFLIEEDEPQPSTSKPTNNIVFDEVRSVGDELNFCLECKKPFGVSWLLEKFNWSVCDNCKSDDDQHNLITKTELKSKYLLKECHLEGDEFPPKLKYIEKQNIKHNRMGVMKLYLECAVIEKAKSVWGDLDKLDEEHEKRQSNRDKLQRSKFDKKMKELKMAVRSSLYRKDLSGHQHEFGEEEEVDEDTFKKKCKTCGHVITYEKM